MKTTASTLKEGKHVVRSACEMCINECGINVHVDDGKIVGIEGLPDHPSRGVLCVKANQIPDWVYHPDRLKYPLRRENGEWKRISWAEALDTIATKLQGLKEREGATSLAVIAGDPVCMQERVGWDMIWRFCDVYGSPNRFYPGDLCGSSRFRANLITVGKVCRADLENSKCIMIWAEDPQRSMPHFVGNINDALKKGAKLIVIDPRRIPFADKADIYVQPRPGTDAALLLAIINIVISEGLYDGEFVEKWTVGFDKLQEHVKRYTAEWAQHITGVAAEDIKNIARMYATNKPASIAAGLKLQQCPSGFQNSRALIILEAITGNVDVLGGSVRFSLGINQRPHRLPEKMGDLKLVGADEYPLYHQVGTRILGEGIMTNWGDLVLKGEPYQVKMMIISAANPALTWPNSTKVKQALDKLDFLVVMDVFMTTTAEMADIVLPACTYLEKYSMTGVCQAAMLRRPVIDPIGESWSDCKFWRELSQRMGYDEYFPWKDDVELLDYFLEPCGVTVGYLRDEHPTGILPVAKKYGEYKEKGFRTPSGKVELYSETLEQLGYDPLPVYLEPTESPISTPELAAKYPLVLITGVREPEFWHSQHRNLTKLQRRKPEAVASMHPDSGKKYGVSDGDPIIVETKTGSIDIKAGFTDDIMPGVVSVPHGWTESNANVLVDDTPVDPVSGYMAFTGLLCSIRKKS
ncbi:molybdopterin-dependent oxidoreductase [Chloroflexota bacterium]